MEKFPQSRRKFITTLTMFLVSGSLLIRFLKPRTARKRQLLISVDSKDVPINGALVFRNERLLLVRNQERELYALSLVCTHLGCTVIVTDELLSCPCHGSKFDRQGSVLTGPADKPLEKFELVEQNGIIKVYGS